MHNFHYLPHKWEDRIKNDYRQTDVKHSAWGVNGIIIKFTVFSKEWFLRVKGSAINYTLTTGLG